MRTAASARVYKTTLTGRVYISQLGQLTVYIQEVRDSKHTGSKPGVSADSHVQIGSLETHFCDIFVCQLDFAPKYEICPIKRASVTLQPKQEEACSSPVTVPSELNLNTAEEEEAADGDRVMFCSHAGSKTHSWVFISSSLSSLFKSIIMTKEALLRFTVFSFSGVLRAL